MTGCIQNREPNTRIAFINVVNSIPVEDDLKSIFVMDSSMIFSDYDIIQSTNYSDSFLYWSDKFKLTDTGMVFIERKIDENSEIANYNIEIDTLKISNLKFENNNSNELKNIHDGDNCSITYLINDSFRESKIKIFGTYTMLSKVKIDSIYMLGDNNEIVQKVLELFKRELIYSFSLYQANFILRAKCNRSREVLILDGGSYNSGKLQDGTWMNRMTYIFIGIKSTKKTADNPQIIYNNYSLYNVGFPED